MLKRCQSTPMMLICGMVLMGLYGCLGSSPAPDYYLLSSIAEDASPPQGSAAGVGLSVGIGPVVFPDYLDRAQIVTRKGQQRVELSEFNRWAESLEKNFSWVLMENLMNLLKTDQVYLDPWPKSAGVEYRLTAQVIRFDARTGSDAELKVQWMILRESDGEALLVKASSHKARPAASDVESLVAAVNQTLSDFSRSVAEAIRDVSKREHGF